MNENSDKRIGGERERAGRPAGHAEATRRAIVDAARGLFDQKGYFPARVSDIAVAAQVSPATVYAVTGGKEGLLRAMIDEWATAPAVAGRLERIEKVDDPGQILRAVAAVTRGMRQDYGDIMRVVLAAAPHDATAAQGLATATARYRGGLAAVARHLVGIGALRDGIDAEEALDILWFYFGYAGFFTLVDDNGWSYPRTERWLCTAAGRALL